MINENMLLELLPTLINKYGLVAILFIVGVILLAKLVNILVDALARKLKPDPIMDLKKSIDKLSSDIHVKNTIFESTLDIISDKIKSSLNNSEAHIVINIASDAMTYLMLLRLLEYYKLIEDKATDLSDAIESLKTIVETDIRDFDDHFLQLPDVSQGIADTNIKIDMLKNKLIFNDYKMSFYDKLKELYNSHYSMYSFITNSMIILKTIMVEWKLR